MSMNSGKIYIQWTRDGKLAGSRVPSVTQYQEKRLMPTKISLCTRKYERARADKINERREEDEEDQSRSFMRLNLDTPSPTAYNIPTNPPNMTKPPAFTMRPKTYPEKTGGDRVSWGKEWFSNSNQWSLRTDFDSKNKWPSPSDHVPRSTIGWPQLTFHQSPSHSIGTRKEFMLVSKDAKSFPSPCSYDRSQSQNKTLANSPSFTIQQGRRQGTLPFIPRNGSSPGPGSYNPKVFKTSSKVRRPAFTIAKSPRVIGITRNCTF
ncbi:protein STPG3-like [Dendronephthya gigantea]|uniref:protein STPG3-like n=1 Tax=Dendronephthya gigantea TaxID=151771 RepID=UPI00106AB6B1|nr:protein STPG3-like [Dendronephthya gigantea]XP_028410948.1 protein STPG3-like [Dendronephthya gigantea]XP_028410949.1 protein STPG3-like [Dendronephthya gigantea]